MTKEKMMIEQNKANVTKYGAAFLKEGEDYHYGIEEGESQYLIIALY